MNAMRKSPAEHGLCPDLKKPENYQATFRVLSSLKPALRFSNPENTFLNALMQYRKAHNTAPVYRSSLADLRQA